jgi:hypothetical protein
MNSNNTIITDAREKHRLIPSAKSHRFNLKEHSKRKHVLSIVLLSCLFFSIFSGVRGTSSICEMERTTDQVQMPIENSNLTFQPAMRKHLTAK